MLHIGLLTLLYSRHIFYGLFIMQFMAVWFKADVFCVTVTITFVSQVLLLLVFLWPVYLASLHSRYSTRGHRKIVQNFVKAHTGLSSKEATSLLSEMRDAGKFTSQLLNVVSSRGRGSERVGLTISGSVGLCRSRYFYNFYIFEGIKRIPLHTNE